MISLEERRTLISHTAKTSQMTHENAESLHKLSEMLRARRNTARAMTVAVIADDDEGPEHHGHSRRPISAAVYSFPSGRRLR